MQDDLCRWTGLAYGFGSLAKELLEAYLSLILANFHIAYVYCSIITVDAPTILLDAIDAVGVARHIIDVHYADTVIGVDGDVVGVVCRTVENVSVDASNESGTLSTFLFEVDLARVVALRIDDKRVIFL